MIFVTVGHQMPFERLIIAADEWMKFQQGPCFAQIGNSEYVPKHMEYAHFLSPAEFQTRMEMADFVISHAGTGNILNALKFGKPMLVMPRFSSLRETRSDHQIHTAIAFEKRGSVVYAKDESDFNIKVMELSSFTPYCNLGNTAGLELVSYVQEFISSPNT